MILNKTTLGLTPLCIKALNRMKLGITAFSITTHGISQGASFSNCYAEYRNTRRHAECRYTRRRYAEHYYDDCRGAHPTIVLACSDFFFSRKVKFKGPFTCAICRCKNVSESDTLRAQCCIAFYGCNLRMFFMGIIISSEPNTLKLFTAVIYECL
jgi:hypothetical protein